MATPKSARYPVNRPLFPFVYIPNQLLVLWNLQAGREVGEGESVKVPLFSSFSFDSGVIYCVIYYCVFFLDTEGGGVRLRG
ncbi:hypothetical protein L6452_15107 [Arctium lappa]|uniref:Uncharacterized protein n=1 Tax=Arctium lappa TaxID=4217 RepID=A0ACB9CMW7_ARCLA|nr:hypothetical protein L6452_15107 [Arctium lappa]